MTNPFDQRNPNDAGNNTGCTDTPIQAPIHQAASEGYKVPFDRQSS